MKLNIIKEFKRTEIIHNYSENLIIRSFFNIICIERINTKSKIELPISIFEYIFGFFRITRRLFRLDKCNVVLINDQLVIIRKGIVYSYDIQTGDLIETLKLKQCNNVLHQSICVTPNGNMYFGEYGNNKERNPVNVYCSKDSGKSWGVIYTFKAGEIRHIHGCYYDKFTDRIWVLTGDYENENLMLNSDLDFKEIKIVGDGSQKFRAVNLFFEENEIHWIMDSPLERSYHYCLERNSGRIFKKDLFPGPVWYIKRLKDGCYLAGTSVETGEGLLDDKARLYISYDLNSWKCVKIFEKDIFPMPYFKWGVLAFSEGEQSKDSFTMHFESLKKVDGKSFLFNINNG